MKYYKISIQDYYEDRIASYADFINNDKETVFKKIGSGETVDKSEIFDYFFLSSFDKKEFWEWCLFDIHKFYGNSGFLTPNFLISSKLKKILETHDISKPHNYYKSNLKYKNKNFDYFVFQFSGIEIFKNTLSYIDFNKSIFVDPIKQHNVKVQSLNEFFLEYKRIYKENGIDNKLKNKLLTFTDFLDFIPLGTFMDDNLVSERLRNAIQENEITGFEFSELDYEVVIDL